jgi:predicted ABC-type ATPase
VGHDVAQAYKYIVMGQAKKIIIFAGPNGSGKTTFAREFLPLEASCPIFINADLIAAGISPFAPESAAIAAGRLMLELIAKHARAGDSFALETTLSGRGYARMIPLWRDSGYRIELFFLSLPSAQFAIERVAQRVKHGGHNIAQDVIERRFASGIVYFEQIYKPLVDVWTLIDSSQSPYKLIDWSERT